MKISYDILKKFVTPPKEVSARELAETLTMHTVEVESWESQAEKLANIVVGLVTKVSVHPNADKLKLATVDCGKESFEVVCGGVNLKQGMKVAFAKVGAKVRWHGQGDWVTLEAAKIRGVESHGMICAAVELSLEDPELGHSTELSRSLEGGIMVLSHVKAKPGTPLAEALGYNDVILDIDNKSIAHRPDLWGHLGLARELAAVWGVPFAPPEPPPVAESNESKLTVACKNPERCTRYLGLVLGGITVGPSPGWLVAALGKLGMRSLNNVVDVTNYVMLELGQPMHAFDLSKLASADIVVRLAKKGEKIVTLDGVERALTPEVLVIADKKQAQAIAGIMGGQAGEVSESTTHVVLESATFESVGVRKTAGVLGLRTEASARFEKALDPALAEYALRRAAQLLLQVVPGAKVQSPVIDVYPKPLAVPPIELNLPWLMRRLGAELSLLKVQTILSHLGFKVSGKGDALSVTPPSWRATRDVTIPEDLLEEVARIYGYGKIPLAMPKFDVAPPPNDPEQVQRWSIRRMLTQQGWAESITYSFIGSLGLGYLPDATYRALGVDPKELLQLENAVNQDEPYLRPALLPSLWQQLERNVLLKPHGSVRLFELGRAFHPDSSSWPLGGGSSGNLPKQPWHLALVQRLPDAGSTETFRKLRGALDSLAQAIGFSYELEPVGDGLAKVLVQGKHIGGVGVTTRQRSSLNLVVAFAELNLELLPSAPEPVSVRPLTGNEVYVRDLSITVPPGITWRAIEATIRSVSPLVALVELFDVYAEKGSLAFSITLRSPEYTLKSEEVEEVIAKITKLLEQDFAAQVRI